MIRFEAIHKWFGGVEALAGVDLVLPSTGVVALIGPNGAGKSTLINVLSGYLLPTAGHCWFGETKLSGLPPYRIARMGISRTFQDIRLAHISTVRDNVLVAQKWERGESLLRSILNRGYEEETKRNHETTFRVLEFVGLSAHADSHASELSYGQQKLLSLACCLASDPHVMLLDEPMTGVDPNLAQRILDMLASIREKKKLVVMIEHNIDAVRQVAERVIVMDRGRVIADGDPVEVLDRQDILEAYLS